MNEPLAMAPPLFRMIRKLEKNITIRKGRRDYEPGNCWAYDAELGHGESITIQITEVYHCLAQDVVWDDLWDDGFASYQAFFEGMREYYPDFGPETEITVIKWK